ncbi:hypothetical protein B8W98_13530, partial [Lentilactobacillus parakefiri]
AIGRWSQGLTGRLHYRNDQSERGFLAALVVSGLDGPIRSEIQKMKIQKDANKKWAKMDEKWKKFHFLDERAHHAIC